MKNSFVVYHSYRDTLKTLTDEQVGRLFRAILDYEIDCIEPQFIDGMVQMAFNFIKNDLDANRKKYDNVCERNRQNGQKGGRPRNPLGYLETQNNPKKPKKADDEYDNEDDNEYEDENEDEIRKVFICGEILTAVLRWYKYKKRNGNEYNKDELQCLIDEIKNDIKQHGEWYVIQSINHSIASKYKSIIFKPYDHNAPTKAQEDEVKRQLFAKYESQVAEDEETKKHNDMVDKMIEQEINEMVIPEGWEKIGNQIVRVNG